MGSIEPALRGRVAIMTGAGRNIGAAIARGFAEAGADLLLVSRSAGPVEEVAAGIRVATGRQVEVLAADVADPRAVDAIADHAARRLPRVDILVNNAYDVGALGPVLETPDAAWERAFAVNVMAPLSLDPPMGTAMLGRAWPAVCGAVWGVRLCRTSLSGLFHCVLGRAAVAAGWSGRDNQRRVAGLLEQVGPGGLPGPGRR